VSYAPLSPEYVTELRDNPEGWNKGPIEVGRVLPGTRATISMAGWLPFRLTARVVLDRDGNPQVVDLRLRSPDDTPITNAVLKSIPVAKLAAAVMSPRIPGVELQHHTPDHAAIAPPLGQRVKLTDDFLRDVTRLAREAWQSRFPINDFIAAALHEEGKTKTRAKVEAVRGWRKAAAARRRQSPDDHSFLQSGELRGNPPQEGAK
jgi:hypothetical protein